MLLSISLSFVPSVLFVARSIKTVLQIMSGIIQQNNRQITLIIFYNASLRVELPNCIAKSNTPCNSCTYYALKYGAGQTN